MTTGTRPGVTHEFGLTFDETAWPLLYVRFPSKPLSDEGFEFFVTRYTDVVERRIPFATILDVDRAECKHEGIRIEIQQALGFLNV